MLPQVSLVAIESLLCLRHLRVRFSGAIGADDGGKVGISKQQCMMALVGLEV